jgi:hypothetical protein
MMTEDQWLACKSFETMLVLARDTRDKCSDRKLRLFAAACCRQVWSLLTNEPSRKAVEVAEIIRGWVGDSRRSHIRRSPSRNSC